MSPRDVLQPLALAALVATWAGFSWLAFRWWLMWRSPLPEARWVAGVIFHLCASVALQAAFWSALIGRSAARPAAGQLMGAAYLTIAALFFLVVGYQLWAGWRLDQMMRTLLGKE